MAFHFIESWKTCPVSGDLTRRWTYQYGNGGLIVPNGLLMNGWQVSYCNAHLTVASEVMIGFWFTPQAYAPTTENMSFLHLLNGGESNGNNQIGLGLNPDGTIAVFQGSNFSGHGGTTLFNGSKVLELNTQYWIELHLVTHPTAGIFEVRIDGVVECDLTGINSSPTGGNGLTGISLTAGANTIHTFGGMYVGDGADGFLGPCAVERLNPIGWTGETFPNYSILDNLFDAQHHTDAGGTVSAISMPSYNPAIVHALQTTRWVSDSSPGTAYFRIDDINSTLPSGGLTAPTDGLYFEALMSKSRAAPTSPVGGRRRYSALPG